MSSTEPVVEALTGGLGKALEETLLPDEVVAWCVRGTGGQAVALTDRRVLILKAGVDSGAMFGHKAVGFPLKEISSVQYSCGLTQGRVELSVPGFRPERQGFASRRTPLQQAAIAAQGENVCVFAASRKAQFQAVAAAIQAATYAHAAQAHGPAAGAPSIPEQIKQLADLHAAGVLTDEEFEGKKRELLARM